MNGPLWCGDVQNHILGAVRAAVSQRAESADSSKALRTPPALQMTGGSRRGIMKGWGGCFLYYAGVQMYAGLSIGFFKAHIPEVAGSLPVTLVRNLIFFRSPKVRKCKYARRRADEVPILKKPSVYVYTFPGPVKPPSLSCCTAEPGARGSQSSRHPAFLSVT